MTKKYYIPALVLLAVLTIPTVSATYENWTNDGIMERVNTLDRIMLYLSNVIWENQDNIAALEERITALESGELDIEALNVTLGTFSKINIDTNEITSFLTIEVEGITANQETDIEIQDQIGVTVEEFTETSSNSGSISTLWEIPENPNLPYTITVTDTSNGNKGQAIHTE